VKYLGSKASEFAQVECIDAQAYAAVVAKALVCRPAAWDQNLEAAAGMIRSSRRRVGYFARTFAGTYFTRQQAEEIDGIRGRILWSGGRISHSNALAMVALFHGMSKAVAAPGHFAQPMDLPATARERQESVKKRALSYLESLQSCSRLTTAPNRNHYRRGDVVTVLRSMRADPPGVVFADPPYSSAHYSRFYHLLETATLDDAPAPTGSGLYRPDRFQSPYCRKGSVRQAFEELVEVVAELRADLMVTYPSVRGELNGLGWTVEDVKDLAAERFSAVSLTFVKSRQSRLGGAGSVARVEGILLARNALA
jgi:hypothetical protein